MLDRFLPDKLRSQKRFSRYTQFDNEKETGGLRRAAQKVPREKKMPSLEEFTDGYPCYAPYYAQPASKSTTSISTTSKSHLDVSLTQSKSHLDVSLTQSKQKSAVVVTSYLPLPYVKPRPASPCPDRKPMPRSDSGVSLPLPTGCSTRQPEGRKPKPLPLSSLPSLPQAIRAHPRNELQRRTSPTRGGGFESFSPTSPCFSPSNLQSPARRPPAVQRVSTWPMATKVDGPVVVVQEEKGLERKGEDQTYTLTLLTTPSLADNAKGLCPNRSSSPLPPASIALFSTLPASQLRQIKGDLHLLSDKIKAFELSTGSLTKTHTGQTLLGVCEGEREIRRLFVSLRTNWWTLLSDEDRAYKGVGWSLFNHNDEINTRTIEEISRAVHKAGEIKGWATGLCLWKKREGVWVVEKECSFAMDARMVDRSLKVRVRSLMSPSQEELALRRASSLGRPVSV